jgi:hypothetical protein
VIQEQHFSAVIRAHRCGADSKFLLQSHKISASLG